MPVPIAEAVSPRRLIRDEVFVRLLDAIVDGDLTPGEQLYDAEIEKWVGVSRTPVREALNQLAAMGLVEIMPQKRTRVSPIDPIRLRALITTLGSLFCGVVRDTTPLLTDDDKDSLRSFLEEFDDGESMARLVRERLVVDSPVTLFLRRLDNRTLARLFTRHLPEVRRALIAAPSSQAFVNGAPYVRATIEAAIAGDSEVAARAVADFWNKGLVTVADEFAKEAR